MVTNYDVDTQSLIVLIVPDSSGGCFITSDNRVDIEIKYCFDNAEDTENY